MKPLALIFAAMVAGAALAQDAVVPKAWKPVAGETNSWNLVFKFKVAGQDAKFTTKVTRTVVSVESNGNCEIESKNEGAKVTFGSSEQEQPNSAKTRKYGPDLKPLEKEEFNSGVDEMFSAFAAAELPTAGAKPGDKWKLTDKFGQLNKGECEFVGETKKLGRDCHEIKVTYAPADGGTSEGRVFLSADNNLIVAMELTFKEVAVAQGIVSDGSATMDLLLAKS